MVSGCADWVGGLALSTALGQTAILFHHSSDNQMLPIRNASRYRRLCTAILWTAGVAWVAGGGVLVLFANYEPMPYLLPLAYTVVFGAILYGVMRGLERRFKCPQCGGEVEDHDVERGTEGDPKLKLCRHCATLWQIGSI